jgi:lysozyme
MSAISIACDFIKQHEGLRFAPYRDSGGVLTVGWGHTGADVKDGIAWDQDQCEKAFSGLRKVLPKALSDQQMAAILSFTFNLGLGAFKGSTLLKLIEQEDWIDAAKEFIRWDHVGTEEVKGLLIRRFDEAALFLRGVT